MYAPQIQHISLTDLEYEFILGAWQGKDAILCGRLTLGKLAILQPHLLPWNLHSVFDCAMSYAVVAPSVGSLIPWLPHAQQWL